MQWTPKLVRFPGTSHLDQEEIESRNVCGVQTMEECLRDRRVGYEMKEDLIFSINELRTRMIWSAPVTHEDLEARVTSQLRFKMQGVATASSQRLWLTPTVRMPLIQVYLSWGVGPPRGGVMRQ